MQMGYMIDRGIMHMSGNYDLRRLQLEQLTVLDELKRVCIKHNLRFYLAYGSCLGALRHKGFIPWDDDIDVLMPVQDYDKLMNLSDEFDEKFFLQNYRTDPGFKAAIARVRKRGTACIEKQDIGLDCHQGIFIDIYPQYQYPDDFFDRIKIIISSVLYRILLMNRAPVNHGKIIKAGGTLALKVISHGDRKKQLAKYYKNLRKHKNTEYVADLYGMDLTLTRVIKYRQECFQEPKWVEFEGREMPLPTNADEFMKERYGVNFMELPPEDKRSSYHHYSYVSFDREYVFPKSSGGI